MEKIYVTNSFLPPLEEYVSYLEQIWNSGVLTNQGALVQSLQSKLSNFLGVDYLHYINNGTTAISLALSALDITEGEIITTPFSYIATTSAILWQKCTPIFVDIEPANFTIDYKKIEEKITENTKAILAVHIYGFVCNVEEIEKIALKYNLKVIYDAAHAFGVAYKNKSILSYGDISTLSFHATKLFHTVEGGACITADKKVSDKLELQKRFGHNGDTHYCPGINAKSSELHAAMGLSVFPYIEEVIEKRKYIVNYYNQELTQKLWRPKKQEHTSQNYAYYPVLFTSEDELLKVFAALKQIEIFPRRYFYPSINTINYLSYQACPISEDISKRIACLPLYPTLSLENLQRIISCINNTLTT